MATAENIHHSYTVEQYLALEHESEVRYEFYQGEVFAMAGGTMRHNLIIQNIATALRSLRSRGCHVFTENVKLEVVADEYYVYPDVMLTCQAQDLSDNRLARSPSLVIEVLSDSTEAYDRGKKLDRYLRMPSLQAYVIVSQKVWFVGCYERKGDFWSYRILDQPEDILRLESLDWEMSLTAMYEDIVFENESDEKR
jgi:Uma2 family endonuclease